MLNKGNYLASAEADREGAWKMNLEYILGFLCGGLIGFILILFVLKWTKKDGSSKCKFDERQQIVRDRGFKYGFFVLALCNILYAGVNALLDGKLIDTPVGILLCVIISVVVYACYCIWNEGYFALNENPRRVLIAFVLIALLNFGVFARRVMEKGIMENGVLSACCVNLFCGLMFLVLFAVLLLKWIQNRREAE